MSTLSMPESRKIRAIGERVLFDINKQKLIDLTDEQRVVLLSWNETQVLQLLSDAPYIVVLRPAAFAVCEPCGHTIDIRSVDYIVGRLIASFIQIDRTQQYLTVMSRLGYVLIRDVTIVAP